MKWLLVALLLVILFVLFWRRSRQTPQCKSLSCEVETKRPVPVQMPYSWEVPITNPNYKYF